MKEKFPISRGVGLANANLEIAKSHKVDDNIQKNSIALFDECAFWKTFDVKNNHELKMIGFDDLLKTAKYLEEEVNRKELSKGFIFSLLRIWNTGFGDSIIKDLDELRSKGERCEIKRIQTKKWMPHFKWKIAKLKKEKRPDVETETKKHIPWIRIPVSWVSLKMRED